MKIALLGFTKVSYMPYMHFYLNQIDRSRDEVHLIYWQRDHKPDSELPEGVTGHAFDYPMADAIPLTRKIPGILKYGSFARKMLNQLQPDYLIVLHSTTAISIYDVLCGKYKGRYIFDFRDVTYESNGIYRKMVANIVENSALSFTSSDGFRKYLPDSSKLLTSHNITGTLLSTPRERPARERHLPIRVAFWGLLRHTEINRMLIGRLGDDPRFELHYYGRAQGSMLELMEESTSRYKNVIFHGEYKPQDRLDMAAQTDLVHNLYSNQDRTMPIAMSNKYYDGLLFSIPQLCSRGSLMGQLCTSSGIGLECDPADEDFADQLYAYYMKLNTDCFADACDKELCRVSEQVAHGNMKINEVLSHGRENSEQ